ncbi:phosphoribosyltransferase [Streptomyces abyssalis]|uniref:Phosphoribosyltransferase n=1 Tax=Streptomyces abyssalis TaxID=933944 RepID=A0A1E7JSK8_9ACTN|nr:phosphoribosyltransferase [Streptomyces abyssalis]OEU91882.1 phosphoribosyltransferase [Streptomyces abyssalis]OEU93976.1 phosphoribosyltransferase [Streptomyces abyssalis]OEV29173.1 phosphoribosyltransferase [Streptomyces nanshensis]
MQFRDRREAGKALAEKLTAQQHGRLPDPVVLALPRGGVPVADEIARVLGAPLDVVVARKIGAPFQPELGVGAVAGDAPPVYDPGLLRQLGLSERDLAATAEHEHTELKRREEVYRRGRGPLDLSGRSAVVVDDGVATGSTARAALRAVREAGPLRTVLAAPVCSREALEQLSGDADEIVCAYVPPAFGAVGFWYEDFPQLSDEEVLGILHVTK